MKVLRVSGYDRQTPILTYTLPRTTLFLMTPPLFPSLPATPLDPIPLTGRGGARHNAASADPGRELSGLTSRNAPGWRSRPGPGANGHLARIQTGGCTCVPESS